MHFSLRNFVLIFHGFDLSYVHMHSINPPVPHAGSATVSVIFGSTQSTIALINGLGVKYCPAPLFLSKPFFSRIDSYNAPLNLLPSYTSLVGDVGLHL